jgi:hypothetical protein
MEEMIKDITGWHYHTKDCRYCNPIYKIVVTNTTQSNN